MGTGTQWAETSNSGWGRKKAVAGGGQGVGGTQAGLGLGMDREGDGISEARRVRDEGLSWAECPELPVPGSREL